MKQYLRSKISHCRQITKIRGEASDRAFYRLQLAGESLIAMVYPQPSKADTDKITHLTGIYKAAGVPVPDIKDIIDERIIIQQDLGNVLVQQAFTKSNQIERSKIIKQISSLLISLSLIQASHATKKLDHERMFWEMDFFVQHFIKNFFPAYKNFRQLAKELHLIVSKIGEPNLFAHRDFHSRNMLLYKDRIFLVDFQDSLLAPPLYDLVSLAFDSYLDLNDRRHQLFVLMQKQGWRLDQDQLYLTALQRNIKALGTFGYQIHRQKNLLYKKYVNRTIRNIMANPMKKLAPSLDLLREYS